MSRRCFLLSVVLGLLGARPALADDTDDLRALLSENVITTASTSAQTASTAPATSVTLTAEDLSRFGIRTLDEAINFLSLGVIAADPLRTPDVGARGVLLPEDNGKHFLVLVNGHAMNDPLYGAARFDAGAGIPLDVIDHVEVIVGPGSVLYGSNAMLGVINVITKTGSEYRGGHLLGDYEIQRSARGGAGTGFTFTALGQPGEMTASVEHYRRFGPDLDFSDIGPRVNLADGQPIRYRRDGSRPGIWGGELREAYFTEATSGAVRVRLGDFELNLLGSSSRRGIPYTTGAIRIDFDDPDSYELDRAVRLDAKHQATLSSLIQLTSRVYADSYDYQRAVNRESSDSCYVSAVATCQYYDAGLARWVGIEERISFNWLEDLSLVTLVGFDARMRWVWTKQDALEVGTGRAFQPTVGQIRDSAGIVSPYVQQTWSPTRWLDLNAGARLDADERFDPVVSPRGAIALSPGSSTTFRGIYSQAFRAPTWSETDLNNYTQARSSDIDPEIVRSLEGSLEQRFATQRVMFGVFRTWWDNMIEPHTLTTEERSDLQFQGQLPLVAVNVVQYRNISSLTNYGYNGGWDGTLADGKLGYGVNVTAAFTRRKTGGVEAPLPAAPQFFGNARLFYEFGGYAPTPALAAYYVGDRPADRAFTGEFAPIPYAPPLAEVRFTLSGAVPGLLGLRYRTSATYATAGSGAYAAGPGSTAQTVSVLPASIVPVDQFRVMVGLSYDFLTGAGGSHAEEAE
jgi:outer membrane receptor for ferrienterochelin and colicins